MRSPARNSDTADAIAARVQAFRELKNVVDDTVLDDTVLDETVLDDTVLREIEVGGTNPANGLFARVRRLLSF